MHPATSGGIVARFSLHGSRHSGADARLDGRRIILMAPSQLYWIGSGLLMLAETCICAAMRNELADNPFAVGLM